MLRAIFGASFFFALAAQSVAPPSATSVAARPTFKSSERIVATHYFYWYRAPDQHFDQLTLHFPVGAEVSYESKAWHRRQLADMRAAGIDVCLPVYWGAPDHEQKPDIAFSVRGLPALVAAADELAASGVVPPRIGMFYDTSTLLADVRGVEPHGSRADLRTSDGRELFARTIDEYFRRIPPRDWACIDGRPIVVLYSSGFAAGWDQRAFDFVGERFARDFAGVKPFIVRDVSWSGVATDASCAWGAALSGAKLGLHTVQIGPGYDDSAVIGRTTPIREREEGRFYEKAWRAALRSNAELAIVETWNEMHEGTSIAETTEYGRKYIELTARYSALFKRREVLDDDIALKFPSARPRPDGSWGELGRGASAIEWRAGSNDGALRWKPWADGPGELPKVDEPRLVSKDASSERVTYLYFQASDAFAFDVEQDFELELDYLDDSRGAIDVQFDSRNERATLEGAYTNAARVERTASGAWKTATIALAHARFANRENGASDLRLSISGSDLAIRALRIRRR